jgi:hypothetical protein
MTSPKPDAVHNWLADPSHGSVTTSPPFALVGAVTHTVSLMMVLIVVSNTPVVSAHDWFGPLVQAQICIYVWRKIY